MDSIDPGDPLSYSSPYFTQIITAVLSFEYVAATMACFFLLLLSALASGAEAAFFALSDKELENYRNSGIKAEQKIYRLLQTPRKLLTTLLIINNGINVSIITLFAYISWQLSGTRSLSAAAIIGCMLVATFSIVFFGEVLPKIYANKRGAAIARKTAPAISLLQELLEPLSGALMGISAYIEKHYLSKSYHYSIQELHHSLDMALVNEETSPEERKLLRGIVNFGSITVGQIMRQRKDIVAFDKNATIPELLPQILKWGYSRVPVYAHSKDNIEGILYIKDLLPHINEGPDFKWQHLIRTPLRVTAEKHISELLDDFKDKHVHMAIVVDEAGATTGLLTLEDVVEEIVGEINDEFDDDEEIIYSQLDENTFIFDGKTSLHDFCKIAEIPFDAFNEAKSDALTIAGLMVSFFGRVPRVGETVSQGRFHFTIESADIKRVKRIKINVTSKKEVYQRAS
ncbi:gliding motility-associated protein GldE [Pontibacter beigongshangensis]|uniref:gliding motility-associated protein GldE n=1 Tax=Pontibacter beigongshangensis TaxID=2574733 RepID=UPI001F50CB15|nr:gliding motility-associated protein GldE [Pontibacter beigongshangensis]